MDIMENQSVWVILVPLAANGLLVWCAAAYGTYLKRVSPATGDTNVHGPLADQRFKRLSNWFALFYFALTLIFAVLIYFALKPVANWLSSTLPAAEMSVLCSAPAMWQLVAFFAAMGLTALSSGPIMRSWWPDAGLFFSTYLSVRRYGCDYDRLCRGLSFPVVLIAAVVFAIASNSYVQARSTVIAEHPFFASHETTYAYSDIKSIETAETHLGKRGYGRDYRFYSAMEPALISIEAFHRVARVREGGLRRSYQGNQGYPSPRSTGFSANFRMNVLTQIRC